METLNVLVTGVGGDLGQAIIKALRLMNRPVNILGCDAASNSVGEVFVDQFFSVPLASDKDYPTIIDEICNHTGVQLIIPSSEPEINRLSHYVHVEGGVMAADLVCHEYDWLQTYGDKFKCYQALGGTVILAQYALGEENSQMERFLKNCSFPCVIKSRRSWGSKSLKIAQDRDQVLSLIAQAGDTVVQEYIDDQFGEFSVGVFAWEDFTAAVAFKRELGPVGASWYAENYDQDEEVLSYCLKISEKSKLQGSCNIQVRKSSRGVRLLEINTRFSSLAAARAACGFKDVEWTIDSILGQGLHHADFAIKPIRFRRFFHELIDFGEGYQAVAEWMPKYKKKLRS